VMWTPYPSTERHAVTDRSLAERLSTAEPPRQQGSIANPPDKRFLARAGAIPAESTSMFPRVVDGEFRLPSDPWEPDRWWRHVADDHWNAFAGVDSVREGVAPIGRSVRRAMNILMTRVSSAAISSPQPPAELPVDRINEQTSRWTAETDAWGVA